MAYPTADQIISKTCISTKSNTPNASWSSATAAGNKLYAIILMEATGTNLPTVTATPSGWSLEAGPVGGDGGANSDPVCVCYSIENAASRSGNESFTVSASCSWIVYLISMPGVASVALDKTAVSNNLNAVNTADTGLTAATTQADEVSFGAHAAKNQLRSFSAQTNSFSQQSYDQTSVGTASQGIAAELVYKHLTSTGTQQCQSTLNTASQYGGLIVTAKQAASGTVYTDTESITNTLTPLFSDTKQDVDTTAHAAALTPSVVENAQFVDAISAYCSLTPSVAEGGFTDSLSVVEISTLSVANTAQFVDTEAIRATLTPSFSEVYTPAVTVTVFDDFERAPENPISGWSAGPGTTWSVDSGRATFQGEPPTTFGGMKQNGSLEEQVVVVKVVAPLPSGVTPVQGQGPSILVSGASNDATTNVDEGDYAVLTRDSGDNPVIGFVNEWGAGLPGSEWDGYGYTLVDEPVPPYYIKYDRLGVGAAFSNDGITWVDAIGAGNPGETGYGVPTTPRIGLGTWLFPNDTQVFEYVADGVIPDAATNYIDSFSVRCSLTFSVTDTAQDVDTVAPRATLTPTYADTAQFVDTISVASVLTPSYADVAQFVDAFLVAAALTPSYSDQAQFVDTISAPVALSYTVAESASSIFVDAFTASETLTPSLTDVAAFVDTANFSQVSTLSISDSASFLDTFVASEKSTPAFVDVSVFADSTVVNETSTFSLSDVAAFVDSTINVLTTTPAFVDATQFIDQIFISQNNTLSLAEHREITDSYNVILQIAPSVFDTYTGFDSTVVYNTLTFGLVDLIIVSGDTTKVVDKGRFTKPHRGRSAFNPQTGIFKFLPTRGRIR